MLSKVCAELFNSIMHLLREALLALSSGAERQHDLLHAQKQVILLLLGTLLVQIFEPRPLDRPEAKERTYTTNSKDLPAMAALAYEHLLILENGSMPSLERRK